MLVNVISVLVPVLFVLALGFAAGRAKAFKDDAVSVINELVLDFALPATLFAGTISVSRSALFEELPLFLALLVSLAAAFTAVFVLARGVFRHSAVAATVQALGVAFAAGPFSSPAILSGIYDASSAVAVSLIAIVLNVVILPAATTIIGLSRTSNGGARTRFGPRLASSFLDALKTPYVWAPILAIVLVLTGVEMPTVVISSLQLIGTGTSGVALFVAGLTLSARRIVPSVEVIVNTLLKLVGVPALYAACAVVVGLHGAPFSEGLILAALPTGAIAMLFATRYREYQDQASSTLAMTNLGMIATLPIILAFVGGTAA